MFFYEKMNSGGIIGKKIVNLQVEDVEKKEL